MQWTEVCWFVSGVFAGYLIQMARSLSTLDKAVLVIDHLRDFHARVSRMVFIDFDGVIDEESEERFFDDMETLIRDYCNHPSWSPDHCRKPEHDICSVCFITREESEVSE